MSEASELHAAQQQGLSKTDPSFIWRSLHSEHKTEDQLLCTGTSPKGKSEVRGKASALLSLVLGIM